MNLVANVRKEKNVSQVRLAKAVGITRGTLISIEKGVTTPSVTNASKIAKALFSTVEELFPLESDKLKNTET